MPYTTQWSLLAKIDMDAFRENPPEYGEIYYPGHSVIFESDFPGVTIERKHPHGVFLNAVNVPKFDAVNAVFILSTQDHFKYFHRNGAVDFWRASGLYHDFGHKTTGAVWPLSLTDMVGEVTNLECYLSRRDRPGMARLRRPRIGDGLWENTVTWSHDAWFSGVQFDLEMPLNVVNFGGIAFLYINAAPAGAQNFWTDFRHSVEVV